MGKRLPKVKNAGLSVRLTIHPQIDSTPIRRYRRNHPALVKALIQSKRNAEFVTGESPHSYPTDRSNPLLPAIKRHVP